MEILGETSKEPVFNDVNMENETKPVDVKTTTVQDTRHVVKEDNVKCNCDD